MDFDVGNYDPDRLRHPGVFSMLETMIPTVRNTLELISMLETTIVISLYINAQKQFAAIFFKNHGFSFSDNAVIRLVDCFAGYNYYAKT